MDVADGTQTEMNNDAQKLKHTKIVVWVEEALQDLLVVSFVYGNVSFQGVLLHSSRKKWPYGLMGPSLSSYPSSDKQENAVTIAQQLVEADDDNKLFAVSRRFTYLEEHPTNLQPNCESLLPRRTNNRRFDRGARTMRLRPRQVLCSKCKSICNENSENVEEVNAARRETDIDKSGGCALQRSTRRTENISPTTKAGQHQACDKAAANCKKRAVDTALPQGSNETKRPKEDRQQTAHKTSEEKHVTTMAKTTPFIKISFGPQGTIVKIPPRTRTYTASDTDASTGEGGATPPQVQLSAAVSPSHSSVAAKAAKKALKKAKKEARRKMSLPNSSPLAHLEIQKQRHHKHKFKHKRKHREENELANESDIVLVNGEMENWDCNNVVQMSRCGNNNNDNEYNDLIKKECLKQKLSISLKRLSEKSYTKCSSSATSSGNSSNSEDSNSSNKSTTTNSNSEADEMPEFPENEISEREIRPLMMRIISHGVNHCTLEDGRSMSVGDVVWGKIHGFPWWPGKVLSITVSQRDNGILISQQAHVAWFGSSTSSCMPCRHLVPFLEDFQSRYNKKKRGPYKEAIKQAIRAAHQVQTSNSICDLSEQTVI